MGNYVRRHELLELWRRVEQINLIHKYVCSRGQGINEDTMYALL